MKHRNVSLFVPHLGCPHTCVFCNQRVISGVSKPLTPAEIIAACETAKKTPYARENSEIAFFGGSFTAIDRETQKMCLETAAPYLKEDFAGIRISTRPDAIDEAELAFLKSYGVTSIELGAQSMVREVLDLNERGHTPEDTEKASRLIRAYGFSLGLQMMTGLYGSDDEKDKYTAQEFIRLSPDTVRIYPTVVLEHTVLGEKLKRGEYIPPTLDSGIDLCAFLLKRFTENHIRVIRLGLHSGGNVDEGFLGGVYHPAFRELVEARLYRDEIEEKLFSLPPGHYIINIKKGEMSKAVGHERSNVLYFEEKGYFLKFRERGEERLSVSCQRTAKTTERNTLCT